MSSKETVVTGWTEGRYNSFITSVLRGGMRRWPPKWQALKEAYVDTRVGKSGRKAKHYKCAGCKLAFPSTLVQVDHCDPVVDPVVGFVSWDEYIARLYCRVSNLQVLCKPCHTKKTKKEKTLSLKASSKTSPSTPKVASTARSSRKKSTKKQN